MSGTTQRNGSLAMFIPRGFTIVLARALTFLPLMAVSQDLDGPKHVFTDALLDNMSGTWNLTGKVMGRNAEHTVEAERVLNHQFLRIHEEDRNPAANGAVPYEAIIMVGYDNTSERYIAHCNDVYGDRFSETLGYGTRNGRDIRLFFEYPDGPFHTPFRWLPESSNGLGSWKPKTNPGSGPSSRRSTSLAR
jgi:hypothetical protein